jgi:hypothetical protein
MDSIRNNLIKRLKEDLMGPVNSEEEIEERPVDRYLTGILYPMCNVIEQDENDELLVSTGIEEASSGDVSNESVVLSNVVKPSCIGLSFKVRFKKEIKLNIQIKCGSYKLNQSKLDGKIKRTWKRKQIVSEVGNVSLNLEGRNQSIELSEYGLEGIRLYLKPWTYKGSDNERNITVALINEREKGESSLVDTENALYQTSMKIKTSDDCLIVPRKVSSYCQDEDELSNELLYLNINEFAVGHTCSATWEADSNIASEVSTTWFPTSDVYKVSAKGSEEFNDLLNESSKSPLNSSFLSSCSPEELKTKLTEFVTCYNNWIKNQRKLADSLQSDIKPQAEKHIEKCELAKERILSTIKYLVSDENYVALQAFQLANEAIGLQLKKYEKKEFNWRPFQLAYQLLVIESLANGRHPDRNVSDLLWFPTGGGKTEAYLGLVAFTLFYSRLKNFENPENGSGVNVIMRYTLRLLTTQQFQRASKLVTACDYIRRSTKELTTKLGEKPFSLGLWVGDSATPNKIRDVYKSEEGRARAKQIRNCPLCGSKEIIWGDQNEQKEFKAFCKGGECYYAENDIPLPIWTIDEDVYRELPSFLIGTIDKFAQILRVEHSRKLFGVDTNYDCPNLIIQDELHLISGPLGTLTGLYEIAIDELCSSKGISPKIITSTATIKNASEQVRGLFNRDFFQFPPHGVFEDNSGFAKKDLSSAGRRYIGISTAGRSAKYALQASCASLLQFPSSIPDTESTAKDAYWTLVAYFNSLRELGGAGVMMRDDVPSSIKTYSLRHEEEVRQAHEISELTGARTQDEILSTLEDMNKSFSDDDSKDVILASNMISVGVDVDRLSLMIVNGQPKTIAEYIQATSRVGRANVPGLVITIYNSNKSRDKSRFENFCTWHSSLYRDVEGASVTPFSSRSRDKALHAPFVALVRYLIDGMLKKPILDESKLESCRELISRIVKRASKVDAEEATKVRNELSEFLMEWYRKKDVEKYWDNNYKKHPLLVSAEIAASAKQVGEIVSASRATPNSMREVEPGVLFRLIPGLRKEKSK